jgi:hypothetical protein
LAPRIAVKIALLVHPVALATPSSENLKKMHVDAQVVLVLLMILLDFNFWFRTSISQETVWESSVVVFIA